MLTVTVDKIDKKNIYPYVATAPKTGTVVLFTSLRKGVCLRQGSGETRVGETSDNWVEENFIPCKVTLESV